MNWIYFGCDFDRKLIKIGQTCDLVARFAKLRKEADHPGLHFVAGVVAEGLCENGLHQAFSHLRIKETNGRECFHATSELCGYIRYLREMPWCAWRDITTENPNNKELAIDMIRDLERSGHVVAMTDLYPDINCRWVPLALEEHPLLADTYEEPCFPEPEKLQDDYYSPARLVQLMHKFYGLPDWDPATCAMANGPIRARNIATKETNGLTKTWHGKVWLNPPYSNWKEWAPKIYREWHNGEVTEMLVMASVLNITAGHFNQVWACANAYVVSKGRWSFTGPNQKMKTQLPSAGHALFYMGKNVNEFASLFNEVGYPGLILTSPAPPS